MLDLTTARTAPLADGKLIDDIGLTAAPPAARFILRGIDAVPAASAALGLTIPTKPMSSATSGDRSVLWLGPDEWLLLAPADQTTSLAEQLSTALAGTACALVDVSHRQTALLMDSPDAAVLLNAGVPLDLSINAFPVGMVARTIYDKAEITLWRTGPQSFRIEVWRTFAPYVLALLQVAARDV